MPTVRPRLPPIRPGTSPCSTVNSAAHAANSSLPPPPWAFPAASPGPPTPRDGRPTPQGHPDTKGRKPLAIVTTVYRPLSHAYHHRAAASCTATRATAKPHVPRHYVHSLYVDQTPDNDLSKEISRDFGVRVTRSIADALTLGGKLAVEGVLLIGEHGNYPRNDKGQILYPRYEFMEQIVERLPQDRPERAGL